jgi:hypothetical protein
MVLVCKVIMLFLCKGRIQHYPIESNQHGLAPPWRKNMSCGQSLLVRQRKGVNIPSIALNHIQNVYEVFIFPNCIEPHQLILLKTNPVDFGHEGLIVLRMGVIHL